MNVLENYLVEVHSVEPCTEEWVNDDWAKDLDYIIVDATFNCYGCIERKTRPYPRKQWEQIKEKGYYMG